MQFEPQGSVTTRFEGQVMDGGGTGRTVTVNVQVSWPHGLMPVQVTAVTPSGKQNVGGGEQSSSRPFTTVGGGYATGVQFEQVKATIFEGQTMMGGWVP